MSGKLKYIFWVLFVVVAIGLGAWTYNGWMTPKVKAQEFHATVLDHPRPMPAFEMQGTNGHRFDNQSLQGHWTFMFFGFTHCGSVCPVTMAELGKMYRLLSQDTTVPRPRVVMVTLDPQRDTLKRMQTYVEAFQPEFLGARGSLKEAQALASKMGIAYTRVMANTKERPNDYSIEHSGSILLINPHADLVAFFTPPHEATLMARDYQLLNAK
ncbi:MAG: SCO family protein [Gammaproteobacteria bacterium]|nr:SCO family protein [Gammaproteobacteria bacterium]